MKRLSELNTQEAAHVLALVAIVASTLSACSQELTRTDARKAIATRLAEEEVSEIALPADLEESHGLWNCSVGWDEAGASPPKSKQSWSWDCELSAEGRKHFRRVRSGMFLGTTITLVRPAKRRVVEFVGIPGALGKPNSTTAHFVWAYDSLDDVVSTLVGGLTFSGRAVFSRYDDGWHLTEIDFSK